MPRSVGNALARLLPPRHWKPLHRSQVWFSPYHDVSADHAFALPFKPEDYVYSRPVQVPVQAKARGAFRRGVGKYRRMLARGDQLPPVTIIYRGGEWELVDGNHRMEAHAAEGRSTIVAVLGYPRRLL